MEKILGFDSSDGGIESLADLVNSFKQSLQRGNPMVLDNLDQIDNDTLADIVGTKSDKDGDTLIHLAVRNRRLPELDELLNRKIINVNEKNEWGDTALHLAAYLQDIECTKKLVDHHASASLQDHEGNTPLHAAFKSHSPKPEVIELLSEAYRSKHKAGKDGFKIKQNKELNTPMHLAALYMVATDKKDCLECIEPLKQFFPTRRNKDEYTAFHLAAQIGHFGVLEAMLDVFRENEEVKQQLDELLTICALAGDVKMVISLIERGADPRKRVLYEIVSKSTEDDEMADSMVQVYRAIIQTVHHWGRRKGGKKDGREVDQVEVKLSVDDIKLLVNGKHTIENRMVTVPEHAVDIGAVAMLKAIFYTRELYQPMNKDGQAIDGKETNEKVTDYKIMVDNLMPCYAGNNDGNKISLVERIARFSDTNAGKMLEIEPLKHLVSGYRRFAIWFYAILTIIQIGYMVYFSLLHVPSPCRYVIGRIAESKDFLLNYRCFDSSSVNATGPTGYIDILSHIQLNSLATIAVNSLWSLAVVIISTLTGLPIQRILRRIISRCVRCSCKDPGQENIESGQNSEKTIDSGKNSEMTAENSSEKSKQQDSTRVNMIASVLIMPPLIYVVMLVSAACLLVCSVLFTLRPFMELLSGNTELNKKLKATNGDDLVWPIYFPFSVMVWLLVFQLSGSYELYVAFTALVFIFGWLQVFYYLSFIRRFRVFTEVLKQIIFKDVINISVLMALVITGFTFAIVSLHQTRTLGPYTKRSLPETFFLTFLEILSPGSDLYKAEDKDDDYAGAGGSVDFLKVILVIYLILTAVILMNLLIAQMGKTLDDTLEMATATWKLPIVRHCVNLRSWCMCTSCYRDNSGGDTVPVEIFKRMFNYQRSLNSSRRNRSD